MFWERCDEVKANQLFDNMLKDQAGAYNQGDVECVGVEDFQRERSVTGTETRDGVRSQKNIDEEEYASKRRKMGKADSVNPTATRASDFKRQGSTSSNSESAALSDANKFYTASQIERITEQAIAGWIQKAQTAQAQSYVNCMEAYVFHEVLVIVCDVSGCPHCHSLSDLRICLSTIYSETLNDIL
jgi:hypothetical protein